MTMKRFKKICIVGVDSLAAVDLAAIRSLSASPIVQSKFIADPVKMSKVIGSSDCLVVSRHVDISGKIFNYCPNLKFIGVLGTGIDNVDLKAAVQHGIQVAGIADYCNRETAEFIVAAILSVTRRLASKRWKRDVQSLGELNLGIIGMGRVGLELAKLGVSFGAEVFYNSKSRKKEAEELGARYLEIDDLLERCDAISLHVPPGTKVLFTDHFRRISAKPRLLINTCIGRVMDRKAFMGWIKNAENMALFDSLGGKGYGDIAKRRNVVIYNEPAYLTRATNARRSGLSVELLREALSR